MRNGYLATLEWQPSSAFTSTLDMTYENTNETQGSSITGPTALGVSHEYDRIAVWLDPMVNTLITGPNSIVDLGDVLDPRDPLTADGSPDVVYLSPENA